MSKLVNIGSKLRLLAATFGKTKTFISPEGYAVDVISRNPPVTFSIDNGTRKTFVCVIKKEFIDILLI